MTEYYIYKHMYKKRELYWLDYIIFEIRLREWRFWTLYDKVYMKLECK